jgi:hypothetical protein
MKIKIGFRTILVLYITSLVLTGCICGDVAMPQSPVNTPGKSPLVPSTPPASMPNVRPPAPGTGSVIGQFTYETDIASILLYGEIVLGGILDDDNGIPMYAYANPEVDPKANWDPNGFFYFTDVSPGTYSLVYWNPQAMTVLVKKRDPNPSMIIVDVVADEQVYVGEVTFPSAPTLKPTP